MMEYNKIVTAALPDSTRAMTKLKSRLDCAPLPPSTPSERDTRLGLKRICREPVLAVLKHRINFEAKYGTDIAEKLSVLVKGQLELEEFISQVEYMLLDFLKQVEKQESFTLSVDTYLNIQLCSLKECLNLMGMKTNFDHQLMNLRSRIKNRLDTSNYSSQIYIDQVLESFDRPGKRLLESIDFDSIFMIVKHKDDVQEIPIDILHITKYLVSESNINIAMAEDKFSQINQIKEILCNVHPQGDYQSLQNVKQEVITLMDAMASYFKLDTTNTEIQSQIEKMCQVSELFHEFSNLMSNIGKEMSSCKNVFERETAVKLDILLNVLKLQLFCMVGIMDPAEKQDIKRKYTEEDLKSVRDRLKVFGIFNEIIGCHHCHSELLEKREANLVTEASRRSCLVALRSSDENFYNLSNELSHFAKTVGQVSNVLEIMSKIQSSSVSETDTWVTSVISFVRKLESYSTYPDITEPVGEAACVYR